MKSVLVVPLLVLAATGCGGASPSWSGATAEDRVQTCAEHWNDWVESLSPTDYDAAFIRLAFEQGFRDVSVLGRDERAVTRSDCTVILWASPGQVVPGQVGYLYGEKHPGPAFEAQGMIAPCPSRPARPGGMQTCGSGDAEQIGTHLPLTAYGTIDDSGIG